MSFVTPNISEIILLRYLLNNISPGNAQLHLFNNNITPSESDQIANYTEPSLSTGYTPSILSGSGWTFQTSGGTSSASFASQTFSFTTSSNIYGWFMTNRNASSNQEVIFAESFPSVFSLPSGGGNISVQPNIILE